MRRNIGEFSLLAITSRHDPVVLILELLLLHSLFLDIFDKALLENHELMDSFFIFFNISPFSLHFLLILEPLSLFFTFSHLFIFLHLLGQITLKLNMLSERGAWHLTSVLVLIPTTFVTFLSGIIFHFVSALMRISYLLDNQLTLLLFFFETFQLRISLEFIIL